MIPGGMVESQSGSRVGCVNPACWAGSHMGSRVGPGWELRGPTNLGVIPPFLPGIPVGIGGIPPTSRLNFYLGFILIFFVTYV